MGRETALDDTSKGRQMWLGLAWRRQAPPLLYSTTGTTCIGVAALASAMLAYPASSDVCTPFG
ncbi:MAG TPA: hypothetical protein VK140_15575 [Ktedonobacteraceae bacterium]|nr:hypothetical protein [Ktedonobacteraceae bacterium]